MRKAYLIGCLLGWISIVTPVKADSNSVVIYKFLDEKGVLHLSNKPPEKQEDILYSRSYVVHSFAPKPLTPLIIPIPDWAVEEVAKVKKSARKSTHSHFAKYHQQIESAATQFNLSPALLRALITVESNFNADAVSPKGAIGLMQIIPATGERYGATDLTDPTTNIACGANYLSDLLNLFDQDLTLALAAYNAGENAVIRYGNKIPPYTETKNYVKKVTELYQQLSAN